MRTELPSPGMSSPEFGHWPDLTLSAWEETRDTLHMWTQIVGKVRLALEPMVNHWWQVPLYVSARGLTTSLMHAEGRGARARVRLSRPHLARAHVRRRRTTRSRSSRAPSRASTRRPWPRSLLSTCVCRCSRVRSRWSMRSRSRKTHRGAYDADAARRFWLALIQAHRVMTRFRARFLGKVSPVHFFWGAPDLAVTRFSGRPAPRHPGGVPNCADWVQQLAYSHEVSSCGFWPGGERRGRVLLVRVSRARRLRRLADDGRPPRTTTPRSASSSCRTARCGPRPTPTRCSSTFFQDTYDAAADLAGWDRAALEVPT